MARAGEGYLFTECGVFRNISDSNFVVHPKFVPTAVYYDVAVLHVEKRFVFNQFIQPICLPDQDANKFRVERHHVMRFAGRRNI